MLKPPGPSEEVPVSQRALSLSQLPWKSKKSKWPVHSCAQSHTASCSAWPGRSSPRRCHTTGRASAKRGARPTPRDRGAALGTPLHGAARAAAARGARTNLPPAPPLPARARPPRSSPPPAGPPARRLSAPPRPRSPALPAARPGSAEAAPALQPPRRWAVAGTAFPQGPARPSPRRPARHGPAPPGRGGRQRRSARPAALW